MKIYKGLRFYHKSEPSGTIYTITDVDESAIRICLDENEIEDYIIGNISSANYFFSIGDWIPVVKRKLFNEV